ncbi:hypothetical protein H920_08804 [Fukomys damarensis]|uniref:Uncharacterized protein n=1 Tax=Fukomys damarensis TaxID=885580 RepID=A0A091DFH7_FUKDA|nr:hypothetical protein H920_08804 [Fukomys damarensis]
MLIWIHVGFLSPYERLVDGVGNVPQSSVVYAVCPGGRAMARRQELRTSQGADSRLQALERDNRSSFLDMANQWHCEVIWYEVVTEFYEADELVSKTMLISLLFP